MNELTFEMLVVGILFGVWPLMMNRSGLDGMSSAAAFSIIVAIIVVPVALRGGVSIAVGANLWFAVAAGCCGALGLLVFNNVLSKATPVTVGNLFVIMIVVQTAIPAVYHVFMKDELTLKTGLGFVAAIIAAVLLV